MKLFSVGRITVAVLFASIGFAVAQTVPGPTSEKPFDEKWAPSKWGANDRAGSANHTNNPANDRARPRHDQAEQGHHDRQVLPPRGPGLRPARDGS